MPIPGITTSFLLGTADDLPPDAIVFGETSVMKSVKHKLEAVAGANVPVLIQGESGTGKEIIAKLIHRRSPWFSGPYVKVNCPAIPGTLLESELFGYEKGAFTGANGAKPGRVELANRGTLFLDEIGEMDFNLQAKLLQLLQDGAFCRIGAQEEKKVEVRVICATNRNLEDEIEQGTFRRDLFYRINVVSIQVPSLRARVEDIPVIATFLLDYYNEKFNCKARPISAPLARSLQQYSWPGNIRELENVMKRYVILGSEESILGELLNKEQRILPPEVQFDGALSLKQMTKQAIIDLERQIILKVLQANQWNRKKTAQALDISYRALLYKIRQAGLPAARARSQATTPRNGRREAN
jgi:two-component system, NtrC family, response regulator AtoC